MPPAFNTRQTTTSTAAAATAAAAAAAQAPLSSPRPPPPPPPLVALLRLWLLLRCLGLLSPNCDLSGVVSVRVELVGVVGVPPVERSFVGSPTGSSVAGLPSTITAPAVTTTATATATTTGHVSCAILLDKIDIPAALLAINAFTFSIFFPSAVSVSVGVSVLPSHLLSALSFVGVAPCARGRRRLDTAAAVVPVASVR